MTDALYDNFRNLILGDGGAAHARPDFDTNDIRVMLYDEGTVARNLATHQDFADISSAEVGTNTALTGLDVGTAGVGAFDHDDEVFTTVSGASVESIVYFDFQTAVAGTSPLIWVIDSWTGLPLTPNGANVTLIPAAGGVFVMPVA